MSNVEIIGIIGGCFYLIAFVEVSLGNWNGKSYRYEYFNLIGAILLLYYSIQKDAYTNMVLNIIWIVVALYVIRHIVKRHKKRRITKKSKKRK
ncbi:MAG TPA: hypothetical protein PKB09_04370 [Candidatus Saccharibacteria bacterium]|nr:hypothetical protein [Candidatus Saccharibacteria bacterium]